MGDKRAKTNYPLISVLSVISRLFEKLVYNQLYKYLHINGLLTFCQSGFRAFHSTATDFLKCTDDWLNSLNAKKYTGVVLVDLKKAFSTVDHNILLQNLALYGIQSHALACFKTHLSNRIQFKWINRYHSSVQSLSLGVPQGSHLGTLLCSICMNDLPNAINNSKVYMYADDTCINLQTDNIPDLNEALNKELEALHAWLNGNRLSLNVAKTQSTITARMLKYGKRYLPIH